jgi:hypothetical protein
MMRSPLLPLLFLACSSATPPERYGFVATLGDDTVSVERVERSPTRLVTDGSTVTACLLMSQAAFR